jgi:xanthine dehydrogenase accessory factor
MNDIYQKIVELKKENKSYVSVTVVQATGSTPGKAGFKMIVDHEGKTFGTVGGGAIEVEAINESKRLMSSGEENLLKEYLLSNNEKIINPKSAVVPMSCNGKIWIYYEAEKTMPVIYIFGGGHVGQALIEIMSKLNYYLVLVDNRQELCDKMKAKGINTIYCEYKDFVEKFTPAVESYFVAVTYGHVYDYEITKTLYKRNMVTNYLGVIASKSKSAGIVKSLKEDISEDVDLSKFHSPIGLKIGGDSAYEIALSIAAEIQAVRYGKKD